MNACPICGSREFGEFSGRPHAVCLECGALERQRALARTCEETLRTGDGRRCLEIGPMSPVVFGGFLRQRDWDYVSIDKWRTGNPRDPRAVGFVDQLMDVADLSDLADESFDLVIAQHVIEEVPDYLAALRAINRVLSPGATALLEIPYDPQQAESRSHDPNHFGNVWTFGRDLLDDLEEIFGAVDQVELAEGAYRSDLMVCAAAVRAV